MSFSLTTEKVCGRLPATARMTLNCFHHTTTKKSLRLPVKKGYYLAGSFTSVKFKIKTKNKK